MKYILHIAAKLDIGGAEKVARDIGMYAEPGEYQSHYVVFWKEIGAYEQELEEHGCKVFHIDPPGQNYRKFLNTLKDLMRTYSYTAVHAHTMFNAGWAMYMAKKMGVSVRVAHAHSALDTKRGWKVRAYEGFMRSLILQNATDLVACGEKAGLRLFGKTAYEKRGQLILNGIDTEAFRYNPKAREKIRSQLNLKDNYVIGHVGHLAAVKNQRFLIDLMPEVLKRKPNARLLLLGEGEDRAMLEQRIRERKLQDAVIMTGNVRNVPDYLSAMDVFAFPSLFEGMPLSILEVQANGLPCVLSTGVPEDVHLTDLVKPIALEQREEWLDAICGSSRKAPDTYAAAMKRSGQDISSAMAKIYSVYEKD